MIGLPVTSNALITAALHCLGRQDPLRDVNWMFAIKVCTCDSKREYLECIWVKCLITVLKHVLTGIDQVLDAALLPGPRRHAASTKSYGRPSCRVGHFEWYVLIRLVPPL